MDLPVVRKILECHWDWVLPVKVDSIGRRLSIQVRKLDPLNAEHTGLSGMVEIQDDLKLAYFNASESINRQRFALAHGIGHLVLGHVISAAPRLVDGEDGRHYSASNSSQMEQEANNFAMQLLMPKDAIDYVINQEKVNNINYLAVKFGVSEVAMHARLKNLGWMYY
nr:ImmA/IrrE family metallo-endopeptidase [Motilimonas cestriensis]